MFLHNILWGEFSTPVFIALYDIYVHISKRFAHNMSPLCMTDHAFSNYVDGSMIYLKNTAIMRQPLEVAYL